MDASTAALTRPSVARVCVEVDLRKARPDKIWLVNGDTGFWQNVDYERVPSMCSKCLKIGHQADACRSVDSRPTLPTAAASSMPQKVRLEYRPKMAPVLNPKDTADKGKEIPPSSFAAVYEQGPVMVNTAATELRKLKNTSLHSAVNVSDASSVSKNVAETLAVQIDASVIDPAADVLLHLSHSAINQNLALVSHIAASAQTVKAKSCSTVGVSDIDISLSAPLPFLDSLPSVPSDLLAVFPFYDASIPSVNFRSLDLLANPPALVADFHAYDHAEVQHAAPLISYVVKPAAPPCSSAGMLDGASARMDKACDVSEKTYVDVLLGAKLAAETTYADLNPNAPLFVPKNRFAGSSSSVSIIPRFHAIKSAEYPSLPLPNFRIFFAARPQFPQDSLEEPCSPRPSDIFQMFSEGDDVPRLPIQRKKLSISLRASCQDFNAILKKGRRPQPLSFNRKKGKKLAPYSLTAQTSTSYSSPYNAPDFQEQPTANANEEVPGEDPLVEYESNWHSSTSEDDTTNDFDYPLASIDPFMALEYEDFSLSPPRRRKYNK